MDIALLYPVRSRESEPCKLHTRYYKYIKFARKLIMLNYNPLHCLPSAEDLPDSDDTPVDNQPNCYLEKGLDIYDAVSSTRSLYQSYQEDGGNPEDWVKKTSLTYKGVKGMHIKTHWYENLVTGQKVEPKTITNPDVMN